MNTTSKGMCVLFFILGATSAISTISVAAYCKGYIALAPTGADYAHEDRQAYLEPAPNYARTSKR